MSTSPAGFVRPAAVLIAAALFSPAPLCGQRATLDVATVKPNNTGAARSSYPRLRNGTLSAENITLKRLIGAAYGLSDLRLAGPDWLDSVRFDVAGKAPEGTRDTEFMPLLQALLQDRFHLEVHRERKEMPAFDMIVGKGGMKLQPFDPAHPPETPPNTGGALMIGVGTLDQIADTLAGSAGQPVVNRTGVEGRYVYIVHYTPLSGQPADLTPDAGPPDLFTAVQQQLGLRLEARKQPIEILVVDRADRVPAEN
ncbi:MAG: TIGR03435 family protein [Acidobacteriota bacterium]